MWMRLAFVLCLCAVGCGDDAKSNGDAGGPVDMGMASDATPDGGGCPASSPYEELLNATTTADIVHKTPTHPPIGDGGLP